MCKSFSLVLFSNLPYLEVLLLILFLPRFQRSEFRSLFVNNEQEIKRKVRVASEIGARELEKQSYFSQQPNLVISANM